MPQDELKVEIQIELELIEELFEQYAPYLDKEWDNDPGLFEMSSYAMFLHSFYNGLENIFARIAKRCDDGLPGGPDWHTRLLRQMTIVTENRDYPIISEQTYEDLKKFLGFRHFSRHAYAFNLDWDLMMPLLASVRDTKEKVVNELNIFLERL